MFQFGLGRSDLLQGAVKPPLQPLPLLLGVQEPLEDVELIRAHSDGGVFDALFGQLQIPELNGILQIDVDSVPVVGQVEGVARKKDCLTDNGLAKKRR